MEYIIYNKESFRDLSHLLQQTTFVCLIPSPLADQETLEGRDQVSCSVSCKVHLPTLFACHHLKEQASHVTPVMFPSLRVSSKVSAT